MTGYVQPKTRIKIVEDGFGVRYYAQEFVELGHPFSVDIDEKSDGDWIAIQGHPSHHFKDEVVAKQFISAYLVTHRKNWERYQEQKRKGAVKRKVSYTYFP